MGLVGALSTRRWVWEGVCVGMCGSGSDGLGVMGVYSWIEKGNRELIDAWK